VGFRPSLITVVYAAPVVHYPTQRYLPGPGSQLNPFRLGTLVLLLLLLLGSLMHTVKVSRVPNTTRCPLSHVPIHFSLLLSDGFLLLFCLLVISASGVSPFSLRHLKRTRYLNSQTKDLSVSALLKILVSRLVATSAITQYLV